MEKVWVIHDPDKYLEDLAANPKKVTVGEPLTYEKSPATAYTLSILFWGGGQFYIGQKAKGEGFLFTMLLVCAAFILVFDFWTPLIQFLRSQDISYAKAFLFAEFLLFCVLIYWTYNAGDAYHAAANARRTPFTGVKSHVSPFLCSLLVPGWGQFLNGQPVKGSIFMGFSVLSLFSLLSITSTMLVWTYLGSSDARFIVEEIFAISVLFAPLIPLIWIYGSFDALRVSLDDLKKESISARIKAAYNRTRYRGLLDGAFPHIKSTITLGLVLTIMVAISYYYYFPKEYYIKQIEHLQATMQKQGMTLVPNMIDSLRFAIAHVRG